MAYFSIKCCDPSMRKLFLLIINILIFCWGAVHLGYAGILSVIKLKSLQYLALLPLSSTSIFQMKQSSILTDGPLAYYVVTGVVALVVSVVIILVVLQVVGKEDSSSNRVFWFKLLAAMLVVNLLLEFGAAIYSTIMLSFYGLLFQTQINLSQDLIDIQPLQSVKDYYNGVRNFYRLSQAQVIVLWIFILPTTAMMIFALFEEFFKHQQPEEPTKIAPERLQTEEKSKVYEKIQVESFGVEGFGANKSQQFVSLKK